MAHISIKPVGNQSVLFTCPAHLTIVKLGYQYDKNNRDTPSPSMTDRLVHHLTPRFLPTPAGGFQRIRPIDDPFLIAVCTVLIPSSRPIVLLIIPARCPHLQRADHQLSYSGGGFAPSLKCECRAAALGIKIRQRSSIRPI